MSNFDVQNFYGSTGHIIQDMLGKEVTMSQQKGVSTEQEYRQLQLPDGKTVRIYGLQEWSKVGVFTRFIAWIKGATTVAINGEKFKVLLPEKGKKEIKMEEVLKSCFNNGVAISFNTDQKSLEKYSSQMILKTVLALSTKDPTTTTFDEKKEAFEAYQKAADQGNAEAQNTLGTCYLHGIGVKKDVQKALVCYEKAARLGDVTAENNLGYCYQLGIGVEKDPQKAIEWYQKAATQGDPFAQNNLGYCYRHGIGVEKDDSKAFQWYEKAANQGESTAQNNLGYYYKFGIGVEKDPNKAFEWYEKAATLGNASSQNSLGNCYLQGIGVEKNLQKAREWYEKAAAQGNVHAQNSLKRL